jgi:hypothetical protein
MINYFVRVWKWTRIRQGLTGDPTEISSHARVSLVPNGAIFLNSRRGIVFTSNHIGALIWQGLLARESLETIAARISRQTGVLNDLVRRDAEQFVAELESHGFLFRGVGCRV